MYNSTQQTPYTRFKTFESNNSSILLVYEVCAYKMYLFMEKKKFEYHFSFYLLLFISTFFLLCGIVWCLVVESSREREKEVKIVKSVEDSRKITINKKYYYIYEKCWLINRVDVYYYLFSSNVAPNMHHFLDNDLEKQKCCLAVWVTGHF